MPVPPPEIIAHRGYSAAAPENTLAALGAALDAGAEALEWDVRMARDGTPVLFHDDTLDRTTDATGPMDALTAGELAELDAGGWFAPEFRGEPVPSLAGALDAVGRRARKLYPEIKAYQDDAQLQRTLELFRERGLLERAVFISMEWEALEVLRALEPRVLVGYIVEKAGRFPAALERALDDPGAILALDYRIVLADPAVPREARDLGVEMGVWTVDDPEDARRLRDRGVTHFTTNRVRTLLEWSRSAVR